MAKTVGENQIHKVTLTMPYDLSGQTLEAQYVDADGNVTAGGTASGDSEGNDVTITTDLASKSIGPGFYDFEVKYDDGGTDRELQVSGEDRIRVNDATSV